MLIQKTLVKKKMAVGENGLLGELHWRFLRLHPKRLTGSRPSESPTTRQRRSKREITSPSCPASHPIPLVFLLEAQEDEATRLEDVPQPHLAADRGRTVLAATQHEIGVEHQIALFGTNAEVSLHGTRIDHGLVQTKHRDFLVAEGRDISNPEAGRDKPTGGVLFKAVNAGVSRFLCLARVYG